MKGRIALYAGYFVVMLLLAAYLTGVLQQGILPRFGSQAGATPQEDGRSLNKAEESTSQGSDRVHDTESASEEQVVSPSSAQPAPQSAEQPVASTAPPRSGDLRSTISDQEKALADKRAELARLEEEIRKRKEENEIEEKWLAELKATGAKLTKERDARREAGVKKLAKLYEGMEPEAAALILSRLKKDMATEVLASMKDRQASKVLAAMNGQRAKEISERLEDARLAQGSTPDKAMETTR